MLLSSEVEGPAGGGAVSPPSSPSTGSAEAAQRSNPVLIVAGLGIQWAAHTTTAARRAIETADHVVSAVADPWAARWIASLNERHESLEYPRDGTPRAAIYEGMVARVLELLNQRYNVCAVFYGSPAWLAQPAHLAIARARQQGFAAQMLPGVSAVECLLTELGIEPGALGLQVYEATRFIVNAGACNPQSHLVLCQVGVIGQRASLRAAGRERVAGGLGLLQRQLSRHYPPEHALVLYEAASSPLQESRIEEHSLEKLCDACPSALSTLYVPPLAPAWVEGDVLWELTRDSPAAREAGDPNGTASHDRFQPSG